MNQFYLVNRQEPNNPEHKRITHNIYNMNFINREQMEIYKADLFINTREQLNSKMVLSTLITKGDFINDVIS